MLKSMLLVSAIATLAFSASAAQAAGGCDAGFHRGPGGGCVPNVVRGPAVVVPVPVPAVPYWRGPGWRFYNGCWRGPAGRVHCE